MKDGRKRIGLLARKQIVEELSGNLKDSQACFFLSFNKVGAFPLNVARNNLRSCGANLFVTKNSLFKRLFDASSLAEFSSFLDAETGVVFVRDKDIVKVCKVLVDFSKENEHLNLKGGILNDKKITLEELQSLAKLPSKNVLLGMAVSAFAAPLTGLLSACNQVILKFIWVIEEIKKTRPNS